MKRRPQNGNGLGRYPGPTHKPVGFSTLYGVRDGRGRRMISHAEGGLYGGSPPSQPFKGKVRISCREVSSDTLTKLRKEIQAVEAALRHLEGQVCRVKDHSSAKPLMAAVNPKRCVACGICEAMCAAGAIALNTTAHIDARKCLGCGSCASACPRGAIWLYSRPEAAEAS